MKAFQEFIPVGAISLHSFARARDCLSLPATVDQGCGTTSVRSPIQMVPRSSHEGWSVSLSR